MDGWDAMGFLSVPEKEDLLNSTMGQSEENLLRMDHLASSFHSSEPAHLKDPLYPSESLTSF